MKLPVPEKYVLWNKNISMAKKERQRRKNDWRWGTVEIPRRKRQREARRIPARFDAAGKQL